MIIDKSKYIGYLWWSDATEPEVLPVSESKLVDTDKEQNPFIIEGQLCDDKQSISIKYVDGVCRCKVYNLADIDKAECENEEYVPNRMEGVEKLCFKRVWRPVEDKDDVCCGMEVMKPAELVFVGLKLKEA